MSVLIVKNIPIEGPGTIEEYLKDSSIPYRIAEFSNEEEISDPEGYTHLVVMGGPMAVYEMERYPYLQKEADLIREFIDSGRAVLGICLGAQMIAHVLGAKVYKGPVTEIGWYTVDITPEGLKDPAVSELAVKNTSKAEVFHMHGDTFDLPDGAVLIATSQPCINQAFRYHDRVYALQFHIEVTPGIVAEWFREEEGIDLREMISKTEAIHPEYLSKARGFYRHIFS